MLVSMRMAAGHRRLEWMRMTDRSISVLAAAATGLGKYQSERNSNPSSMPLVNRKYRTRGINDHRRLGRADCPAPACNGKKLQSFQMAKVSAASCKHRAAELLGLTAGGISEWPDYQADPAMGETISSAPGGRRARVAWPSAWNSAANGRGGREQKRDWWSGEDGARRIVRDKSHGVWQDGPSKMSAVRGKDVLHVDAETHRIWNGFIVMA
jgi:hypothetical protein